MKRKREDKSLIEKFEIYKEFLEGRVRNGVFEPIRKEPYLTDFLRKRYGETIHTKKLNEIPEEQRYCIAEREAKSMIKEINPTPERTDLLELILTIKEDPEKMGIFQFVDDRRKTLPLDLMKEFLRIKQNYLSQIPEQLGLFEKSKAY